MSDWPRYECHKVVQAAMIIGVEIDLETNHITVWVSPREGADVETFEPTVSAMKEQAEAGGVAVLYPDGYRSINTAKNFEADYRLI